MVSLPGCLSSLCPQRQDSSGLLSCVFHHGKHVHRSPHLSETSGNQSVWERTTSFHTTCLPSISIDPAGIEDICVVFSIAAISGFQLLLDLGADFLFFSPCSRSHSEGRFSHSILITHTCLSSPLPLWNSLSAQPLFSVQGQHRCFINFLTQYYLGHILCANLPSGLVFGATKYLTC